MGLCLFIELLLRLANSKIIIIENKKTYMQIVYRFFRFYLVKYRLWLGMQNIQFNHTIFHHLVGSFDIII